LIERLDCDVSELPGLLDEILRDSLWMKTMARRGADEMALQRALLIERGRFIWNGSSEAQRRGYFASGVGFKTGRQLDEHADALNRLLFLAEQAIDRGDLAGAIEAAVSLGQIVFTISPFAPKNLPNTWEAVLAKWISGLPMAEIVAEDPEALVEFIESGIVYGLVWAVEAVRVRSKAHSDEFAEIWTGRLAQTLEAGTTDRCATLLIHAGLGSRIAALAALSDLPGDFTDFQEMRSWLASDRVSQASMVVDWPTPETADLWNAFRDSMSGGEATRTWKRKVKVYRVDWFTNTTPSEGELVRIVGVGVGKRARVHAPDSTAIGELNSALQSTPGVLFGRVTSIPNELEIHYHGPGELK
jgi:hypothetical protein